ncbi:hypothetical protein LCGC14_2130700, partial [marine sediment metagenome]
GPGSCGGPDYGKGGYGIDPEKSAAFFKETLKLRKELHEKMFELKEAYFSGDEEKTEKLSKEAEEISEKIFKAAEKHEVPFGRGYGGHMGPGSGGHMGSGYGGHMGSGYGGHMGPGYGGHMGPGYGGHMGPGYGGHMGGWR